MKQEIVCAGFGGQGIMLMGKLLAQAASQAGYQVTWMPSYGAEVRGGTAHSMVVISDKDVACPAVFVPDMVLVLNKPSFAKFEPKIKRGGLIIVNTSLVDDKLKRKDVKCLELPASDIAKSLGNIRVQNMVMLGAFIQYTGIIKLENLLSSLDKILPIHRRNLISVNQQALKKGAEFAA